MKKFIWITLLLTFGCNTTKHSISKETTIKIVSSKNIKIYEQNRYGQIGPCEPSICINPKNTDNIVAGSVLNFAHHSLDGGKTWKTQHLQSTYGVFGDPCIVADTLGNFYYFHLSDPEGTNWMSAKILDQMVVQKSIDGGKSWSSGTSIGKNIAPKQQDKEWATVNSLNNEIYLTWTEFDKYGSNDKRHRSRILFSKSKNQGSSWSSPTILSEIEGNALDDNKTVEGAVPAVGIHGEIFVSWSMNEKIYFDRSLDGGKTWLKKDIVATNQPNGWSFDVPGVSRVNGMPVTCVDISNSKFKGTIYINFSDQRNGKNNTDIFLIKSTDNGTTWSKPLRVNTDNTKTHQFLTWMSVDPKTGFIYIIYYDRSNYPDTQTDVVLAISKDGGASFTSTTISEKPFVPQTKIFFGDYNNISAYNGIIKPIWTRYENGKLSVWTSLIETNK